MCFPQLCSLFSFPLRSSPPYLHISLLHHIQINFRSLVEKHGGEFTTHFNVHVTALIASAVDTEKYRVRRWKWRQGGRVRGRDSVPLRNSWRQKRLLTLRSLIPAPSLLLPPSPFLLHLPLPSSSILLPSSFISPLPPPPSSGRRQIRHAHCHARLAGRLDRPWEGS